MPSVGPFELTTVEMFGLEFMRQEDERQLRKTGLRASWSGKMLTIRVERPPTVLEKVEIDSRVLPLY